MIDRVNGEEKQEFFLVFVDAGEEWKMKVQDTLRTKKRVIEFSRVLLEHRYTPAGDLFVS